MYRNFGNLYKIHAIILSRKNTGEADRIVTVFSKELGKLTLLAKGIRKTSSRRAPYLEIFSVVRLVVRNGKTLDTITEATSNGMQKYTLESLSIAYFYCELINVLLPDRQEHKDVYELLHTSLLSLENGNMYVQSRNFSLQLLRMLGFLEKSKDLQGIELQRYIETITERKLRTPKLIRQLL